MCVYVYCYHYIVGRDVLLVVNEHPRGLCQMVLLANIVDVLEARDPRAAFFEYLRDKDSSTVAKALMIGYAERLITKSELDVLWQMLTF